MLNNIRKFSKSIFAKILMVIIIIPFVFWGMGGVFNSGNTNNIVKINNQSISTQDFIDFLQSSKVSNEYIKQNIDKNIIEEMLSGLVSKTLLEMEIKELNVTVSENSLVNRITTNKNFLDENNKFSRTKYEKFLLTQNITAPMFEARLKDNELKKSLFSYISGGIRSPQFMTLALYKEQSSKLDIEYFDLNSVYKKNSNLTKDEILKFVNENQKILEEEYIDFSYIKILPKNLTGDIEFNDLFFEKIDEIENKISNNIKFNDLLLDLNIKPISKKSFIYNKESNEIEKIIYQNKNNENKIQLVDLGEYYVLFNIQDIEKKLPNLDNEESLTQIKKYLFEKKKFEYNKNLLNKINDKKFSQIDFEKLSNNKIISTKLSSIKDDSKFEINSIKILYSLPTKSFTLIADKENNVYLAKIIKFNEQSLDVNSTDYKTYIEQTNIKIRDNIYFSYDGFINQKYKVKVNQKTLERVKNYFR
jgi:peptidyl-prolyl cis-trans isomerase D